MVIAIMVGSASARLDKKRMGASIQPHSISRPFTRPFGSKMNFQMMATATIEVTTGR